MGILWVSGGILLPPWLGEPLMLGIHGMRSFRLLPMYPEVCEPMGTHGINVHRLWAALSPAAETGGTPFFGGQQNKPGGQAWLEGGK